MQSITIQKKKLILHPLKIRQLRELETFVKEAVKTLNLDKKGAEISVMSAVAEVAENGQLGALAEILFPDQENVKKIKWEEVDVNDIAVAVDSFLDVNAPAIDALKRILMSSGLAEALGS
ncbi:MAG TPA: hypothetical protein ENK32_01025 [Anaerolineae bacterium]|nr:hypothetical protein [Anaerolineae bacterium]